MNQPSQPLSPFETLGGAAAVHALVNRFYDLMDSDPAYKELRALHAADLAPMRESLAGFLIAWLGGPRDWFDQRPGACVMSIHSALPINRTTATQWTDAMRQALADSQIGEPLAGQINEAFVRMAGGMARA